MSKRLNNFLMGVIGVVTAGAIAPALQAENGVLNLVYQGIPHDALYDVCFDKNTGMAVGVAGNVLATEDAGKSWQPTQSATEFALLGVSCTGKTAIAVGQLGHIQVRDDKGIWQKVESGTDQRLLSVSANHSGLAVAAGGFGAVLRSKDGGTSWQPLTFDWEAILDDFLEPHIYDVAVFDDGSIMLTGEFELIMFSPDQGETWRVLNKADSSLFALHFRDREHGFAVGQDGKVLKSVDGGASWQVIEVPTRENLLDVWSSGAGDVFVTGIRTLLRSRDDGATWQSITEGDISVKWYQAVSGAADEGSVNQVVIVGHSGRVLQVN